MLIMLMKPVTVAPIDFGNKEIDKGYDNIAPQETPVKKNNINSIGIFRYSLP